MTNLYEELQTGLQEAIEGVRGNSELTIDRVMIKPVKNFTAKDIKRIRKSTKMSQTVFAGYLGVSNQTIEAWEAGSKKPSGTARRLLTSIEMDQDFIYKYPFVTR